MYIKNHDILKKLVQNYEGNFLLANSIFRKTQKNKKTTHNLLIMREIKLTIFCNKKQSVIITDRWSKITCIGA